MVPVLRLVWLLLALAASTLGLPTASLLLHRQSAKPAFFVLIGDSTTASQKKGNGGWGDGFLQTLKSPASGINHGVGGRTTVNYKSGGWWAKAMADVKKNAASKNVYATIQFGHNDQQKGTGISISAYQQNIAAMAAEIKAAGATPILVTPLERRYFQSGKVRDTMGKEAKATIAAAQAGSYQWIDLHAESSAYLNKIGQGQASAFNPSSRDTTHLTVKGSQVFGQMVAQLISSKIPALKDSFSI